MILLQNQIPQFLNLHANLTHMKIFSFNPLIILIMIVTTRIGAAIVVQDLLVILLADLGYDFIIFIFI